MSGPPGGAADPSDAPRDFSISEYWNVVLKRWRLIALCGVLSLAWAVLNTLLTPPSYRATVVIDVEGDRGSPLDVGSASQYYWAYDPDFLPTQTRLMKSREVSERVVERLKLAGDSEKNPPVSGLLRKNTDPNQGRTTSDAITQAALGIQAGIEVNPIKETTLVELSYVDRSGKMAAEIANAVAESYIDWNLESKYRVVGQASRFLTTQIEQLRSELDGKQQQLLAYGRQNDIVSSDPSANTTLQNVESLNKGYAEAVADRIAKEARLNEILNGPPDAALDAQAGQLITSLRDDQAKLERQYAEKQNIFKPDWPAMQQLKAQIDKGQQHLKIVIAETVAKAREAARSEYQTALRREESLKSALRSQRVEAMKLNSNAVEYNNLRVEVDTKRAMLDALLKRQSETDVMSRVSGDRQSNIRIVDPALPPTYRFRPSYRKDASRGLFLGIALGFGLAFLLEYLDRSLRTPEQVEKYLQLPTIGVIPSVGAAASGSYGYGYGYGLRRRADRAKADAAAGAPKSIELLPHHQPRTTIAEAYRSVRTALLLSRAGGVRSITVTSCFPREGKSTTVANLAVVLSQLGKKVLVIDADLHKPRLHEIFRVSNRVGLVSVLAENADPLQALQRTELPGLFVMPAGPVSPNPSGLLSSEGMTKFLGRAAATFDYVLIDTPPVLPVADAIVIGHQTDGVVLCVKGGKTARDQVRRVRDKLQRSEVRILGVLINNLEGTLAADPSYGYGYPSYAEASGAEPKAAAKI